MNKHDSSINEQRMHPRWILKSSVSVFEHNSKEYLGLLVDCSENGIMLSSYDELAPGTRFELDLVDVPPNIDSRRTGHCTAEVIWSDRITPSLYGNGCAISNQSDALRSMIASYSTIDKPGE